MTDNKHIVLKGVHKAFGSNIVLNGVNLTVNRGESLVVLGGSGTGKSVMLKCILGLLGADSGSICVSGHEMVGASTSLQERVISCMSMLFQGSALFDSLTIADNISFRLRQQKDLTERQIHEKVMEKLAAVGLAARVASLYPAELSGGMLRRAALARAIITNPEIVFFDEPTTGLDPIMSAVINDLISTSVKELGATAVTITHDLASARKIADRVALIHQGKILWHDDVKNLDTSKNPAVEQFVNGRLEGPLTPKS
ncbi:MAG: ATP-binding cassette domain-containing protein [Alphaproteobacteria bacterium]|nr:MAG: ATP-binding cassette domain-containing protein [Alphaproteobacteria bacterium]